MKYTPCGDITGDYLEDIGLPLFLRHGAAEIQYFWIPGSPVPNERARVISRNGKTWTFTPKTTMLWRRHVFNAVYKQGPVKVDPPFSVALKFICEPRDKPADLDNLIKSVLDAVFSDKKAVPPFPFHDDRHIAELLAFRHIAGPGEAVGVKLWVSKNRTTKIL